MLSDSDIRLLLERGDLVIEPLSNPEKQIQPASVDFRVGGSGILKPGDFRLTTTIERVEIPRFLAAQVNGKSSWGRCGLLIHVTAGFIDPGFRGQITLELKNLSSEDISFDFGDPICQIVFFELKSPCTRAYGDLGAGSRYQDQKGTTPSRL